MSLCRVCLEPEGEEREASYVQVNDELLLKIFKLSGLEVKDDESFPSSICLQCVDDVHLAESIQQRCIKAEEYFRSAVVEDYLDPEPIVGDIRVKDEIEIFHNYSETPKEAVGNFTVIQVEISKVDDLNIRKTREKFFCSKCFKSFSDQNYLKKHEYFRHSDIPIEDLFECDFCGHKSKTKQLIRNHINVVHSSKPREKFVCRICGKLLSSKGNLDSHEKTHIDIDPSEYWLCTVCQKPFKEKRFMVEHRKLVHEKSKAVQCSECSHISTCKGAYNKHFKSVHLKLRDFPCSDCDLAFSTNSQLTRHYRIHTGERPYECNSCSKPFRLSSHRKRHEDICPKRFAK